MKNDNRTQYVRDPGYGETETKCSVHADEFAVVYLVNGETMTPLGNTARREIIESERAFAQLENRKPRFINLVPVWCLNAASDIVEGQLTPEINRFGRDRDGKQCKLCATPGCNHPSGNRAIPRKGINRPFCGGCAAALTIVAEKAGRKDLVPISVEKAREIAGQQREEVKVVLTTKATLAASLLGPTTPLKLTADGKLAQNPFAALADPKPATPPPATDAKPDLSSTSEAPAVGAKPKRISQKERRRIARAAKEKEAANAPAKTPDPVVTADPPAQTESAQPAA